MKPLHWGLGSHTIPPFLLTKLLHFFALLILQLTMTFTKSDVTRHWPHDLQRQNSFVIFINLKNYKTSRFQRHLIWSDYEEEIDGEAPRSHQPPSHDDAYSKAQFSWSNETDKLAKTSRGAFFITFLTFLFELLCCGRASYKVTVLCSMEGQKFQNGWQKYLFIYLSLHSRRKLEKKKRLYNNKNKAHR